uniref:Metalloendopeptidase n=1 Tax=Strongyloides papillosus TaxID=174720 RepID=A0A0N5C3C9_STREA
MKVVEIILLYTVVTVSSNSDYKNYDDTTRNKRDIALFMYLQSEKNLIVSGNTNQNEYFTSKKSNGINEEPNKSIFDIPSIYDFTVAREKRKVRRLALYKWNTSLCYKFKDYDNTNLVRKVLRLIQKETCLRFSEKNYFEANDKCLKFVSGNFCNTTIGREKSKRSHTITIAPSCSTFGEIFKLIFNALGVYDEHQRFDRDRYLFLDIENAQEDSKSLFSRVPAEDTNTFGVHYDYGSITHGGPFYHSNKNRKTIITRDPFYARTIGQRENPSFLDFQLLNRYYCQNSCPNLNIRCFNEAYLNPKKCGVCKCPSGFTGPTCKNTIKKSHNCGKTLIKAKRRESYLKLSGHKYCIIHLVANVGEKIAIYLITSAMYPNGPQICTSLNSLEIKYWRRKAPTGARFCQTTANKMLVSQNHHVILIYKSTNPKNWFRILFKSTK